MSTPLSFVARVERVKDALGITGIVGAGPIVAAAAELMRNSPRRLTYVRAVCDVRRVDGSVKKCSETLGLGRPRESDRITPRRGALCLVSAFEW